MTKTVDDMTNDEKLARIRAAMGTQEERDEQREETYRKNNPPADNAQQHDAGEIDAEALDSLVKEADAPRPIGVNFPRFLTPAEFCKDHTGLDYLIKRHVARDQLTMVFGQPSCGKTFYVLDQGLTVAAKGLDDWHGIRIKKGRVLYLTGEGRTGLKQRITAWIEQNNIEFEALSDFRCEYAPFKLNESEHVDAFIKWTKEQNFLPDWIIFDTLAEFMSGDENKAEDAQRVVDGCHLIMSAFHCAVTLIHHQGVSQEAKDQKRSRGSSAYFGALDVQTIIEQIGDDSSGDFSIKAEQTKNKDDSKTCNTFILEKVELQNWLDEDNEPITSRVLRSSVEAKDDGTRPIVKRDQSYITAFFTCAETGRGEITPATGKFIGVRHSVWRDYYCDPATNRQLKSSNKTQNISNFEAAINRLLDNRNIEVVNNNELKGETDHDKSIYTLRGKNGNLVKAHAAEYAEAARNRKSEDEAPSENREKTPFIFRC